jgi:hypothetical protein
VLVVCAGIQLAGCRAAAHTTLLHSADLPDAAAWAQLPAGMQASNTKHVLVEEG